MSDESNPTEIQTAPPIADPTLGAGNRFAELLAKGQAVKEGSPDDKNETAVQETSKPAEAKKEEPKDEFPDFRKKPEQQKKEEPPSHDEELKQHPAIKGEAAKSFKKVLSERDELRNQLNTYKAEMEAKMAELSRTQGIPKEVEEKLTSAQKRAQELEEELGRASFERSPKIQNYVRAEKAEIESAKSYMDGDEAKQAAIETAASLTGKRRIQVLADAGMSSEEIGIIGSNLARIDQLRRDKAADLENWKKSSEEYEQERKVAMTREQEKRKELENQTFKSRFDSLSKELEAYQHADGYPEWNKEADARKEEAQRFFNGEASLEEVTDVIIRGVAYKAKDKLYNNLQKKYDTAIEELSRLKSALPNGGSAKSDKGGQQDTGTQASRFEATLAATRGS